MGVYSIRGLGFSYIFIDEVAYFKKEDNLYGGILPIASAGKPPCVLVCLSTIKSGDNPMTRFISIRRDDGTAFFDSYVQAYICNSCIRKFERENRTLDSCPHRAYLLPKFLTNAAAADQAYLNKGRESAFALESLNINRSGDSAVVNASYVNNFKNMTPIHITQTVRHVYIAFDPQPGGQASKAALTAMCIYGGAYVVSFLAPKTCVFFQVFFLWLKFLICTFQLRSKSVYPKPVR